MTTDKKRIQGYISDECFNALLEFQKINDCSQSKALELLIKQSLIDGNINQKNIVSQSELPVSYQSIESPKSRAPSPSGDLDTIINQDVLMISVNKLDEKIKKLENRFDEFINGKNEINGKIEKRFSAIETQLNHQSNSLIDENKKDDTAPPVISKFYPNQKIFKPYHVEQFKVVYDLLTGFNIKFLSTKNSDVIQQWIVADQDGNKAGLFLNGASHWSLGKVKFGDGDLKGFFENCNVNDNYLDDLLANNLIDLDEIAETADQDDNDSSDRSAVAEMDSPAPLPFKEAIEIIKKLHQKGYNPTEIARELSGNYLTSRGKIQWKNSQVSRVLSDLGLSSNIKQK